MSMSRLAVAIILAGVFAAAASAWAGERPVRLARAVPRESAPAMQTVTGEQMQAALERALQERPTSATEVQVRLLDEPESVLVPAGRLEIRVKQGGDEVLGRRTFQLALVVDGMPARTATVRAETAAWADVVTAAHAMKPNDVLEADDVVVARVPLASGKSDYLRSVDDVVGKRVVRSLQVNKPIVASAVGEPYAVRRGDRVTIEAKRGGLLIQTAGITKGAAQAGDTVTVTNLDSGKDVRARAVGPGTVRVEY
jgi:flagella basal body P-ring formation protein FlgA